MSMYIFVYVPVIHSSRRVRRQAAAWAAAVPGEVLLKVHAARAHAGVCHASIVPGLADVEWRAVAL